MREQFQVQVTDAAKTRREATQNPGFIMGVKGSDTKKVTFNQFGKPNHNQIDFEGNKESH